MAMAVKTYDIELDFKLRLNIEDGTDEEIIKKALRMCVNGFKGFKEYALDGSYVPEHCAMSMKQVDETGERRNERLFFYDKVEELEDRLLSVMRFYVGGTPVEYKPEPLPEKEFKGEFLC